MTSKLKAVLEVTELKMLKFSLGVKRMNRIWNEDIKGITQVRRLRGQREQVETEMVEICEEERCWKYGELDAEYGMGVPGKRERRPSRRSWTWRGCTCWQYVSEEELEHANIQAAEDILNKIDG